MMHIQSPLDSNVESMSLSADILELIYCFFFCPLFEILSPMQFPYWSRFLKLCTVISAEVTLMFVSYLVPVLNNGMSLHIFFKRLCISACHFESQRPSRVDIYNFKMTLFSVFEQFLSCGISSTLRASCWSLCWGTIHILQGIRNFAFALTQMYSNTANPQKRCF